MWLGCEEGPLARAGQNLGVSQLSCEIPRGGAFPRQGRFYDFHRNSEKFGGGPFQGRPDATIFTTNLRADPALAQVWVEGAGLSSSRQLALRADIPQTLSCIFPTAASQSPALDGNLRKPNGRVRPQTGLPERRLG